MAYSFAELKTFLGLFAQSNSFNIPEGAMEIAKNVVINDDNVISKMRGFYRYYSPLVSDPLNNVYLYQNKLMAVYDDFISYLTDTGSQPNVTGTSTTLSGQSFSITSPRKSRSVQQNGNLYWTTDQSIFKLDKYNGTVIQAGASPGLDINGDLFSANGPIEAETEFAVRVVFGRKDANGNVTLGAPSDILILTNRKTENCSYTSAIIGGGPTYTMTVTSAGHNLAVGMTVIVSGCADADANGTWTVSAVTTTTFDVVVNGDPGSASDLDWTATRSAIYWFSIPSDISSTSQSWFYQVYRTSQSGSSSTSPAADFRLIDEVLITSAEITAGFITYIDEVDDILVEFAPELYTNPNSREGEAQANYRPPLCEDITLFNNYMFYGNCESRQFLNLDVVDTASLANNDYVETNVLSSTERDSEGIANTGGDLEIQYDGHGLSNGDTIFIDNIVGGSLTQGTYFVVSAATDSFEISLTSGGASIAYSAVTSLRFTETTIRRYVARTGVGNLTVESDSITNTAGNLQIDYTAHGLQNGDKIYISTISGGSLTAGFYFVVNRSANAFEISLTSGGASVAYSAVTSLYFEGVTNGTYPIFQLDASSSSISEQLRNTATGIIKAVNRDPLSLLFGNYTSGITDTPGKMRFTAKAFTGRVYMRANTTTAGDAFYPVLPASFITGDQVFSSNDVEPNGVYISKIGEPEAVPLVNKLFVGSKNAAIKRIASIRNAVIVLKEDGVFKITGDNPINFTVTQLDNTVSVIASDSVASLNNQIYFLSTEGICIATDTTVSVVSRRIENRIETITGLSDINEITSAVAYDSDRTYRICTALPNSDVKDIGYFHNVMNDTWTETDQLFSGGVLGPNNIMYYISTDNRILKERKQGTRIDYTNQNYTVTVTSVASDGLSAVITSSAAVPAIGYIIVKNDVITRIKSAEVITGSSYAVEFYRPSNIAASDSLQMYEGIVSEVKMAPFTAGIMERGKQFSQLQLHTRNPSITEIEISFSGQTFGGSEQTNWISTEVSGSSGGWGFEPWGFFPWGLADGIDIQYMTQPALVVRIYVPLFQQRGTFIQPYLIHRQGGEALDIQAMSWTLRMYAERVTK